MSPIFSDSTETEEAFYEAFARLDLGRMNAVWADLTETLCIHPGGPLVRGKAAVIESWREILSGSEPPSVSYRALQRFGSGTLAVHLVEELIAPSARTQAEPTRVLATNVYRHIEGSWRLVGHHASLPLVTPRAPEAAQSSRLH